MTLRIFARDETEPPPRDIVLDLRCDGAALFCTSLQIPCNWYPDAASAAVRAGWTLTAERQIGPCCSKKKAANLKSSLHSTP